MNGKNANQSEDVNIKSLIEYICTGNLASEQDARDFVGFIEAPPNLRGIGGVCKNLRYILHYLKSIISLEHNPDREFLRKLPIWQDIAAEISADYADVGAVSLRGDYRGDHALYVALWHSPKNSLLKSRYDLLMAHVCYSAHILRKLKIKGRDYMSARDIALRRIRQLTIAKNEHILSAFPEKLSSLSSYFGLLDRNIDDFQHRIWKLVDYAVLKKRAVTHVGVSRIRGSHEKPPLISGEPVSFIDADELSNHPILEVVPLIQLPEEEKHQEIADTLASPLEFLFGRDVVQFDTPSRIPTSRQDVLTARKMGKRLALDNQLLSFRWRGLNLYEVSCFLEAVDKLAKDRTVQFSTEVSPLELAALLTCMFWTSSSVEIACKFKVYRRKPVERLGKGYLTSRQNPSWVVNPPRPIGYEKTKKPLFQAEVADDLLLLPVPGPARTIIDKYLAILEEVPDKKDEMFPSGFTIYNKAVTNFLGSVNRQQRLRIKNSRIADYLFERLLHQPKSDIVTAMLTTGRSHFLGWVPLHYTSISSRVLQQRYTDACREVLAGTSIELGLYAEEMTSFPQPDMKSNNGRRVGTRYCPRTKTVRTLVSELKQLLVDAVNKPSATTEDILILHNRMVVYTTVMVGFATGYRAVSDPFLRQTFIDPVTGFAVISDKDTADSYHSRILWVPPMVMEQLNLYHKHLDEFGRRLIILNRKLYFEIRERLIEAASRPMLFMLKRNLKSLTVSKGSLEDICEQHLNYTLPANANRHYLRTRLLKRACPQNIISSFMGHWEIGTEPWGRFSSLSPHTYRENLEKYLLPVLKKDGWKAVAGLGGKE